MIGDYADDSSKKIISRYNENEQALEFFEYEPLNEALTFETNDVLKKEIYTKLTNSKKSEAIYENYMKVITFCLLMNFSTIKKVLCFLTNHTVVLLCILCQ